MNPLPAILLVDDDSVTNFLNERLLRRMNASYEVLVATNGQQALELLRQHCQPGSTTCPSLVLLDLNMPVMNGMEFLEQLVRQPDGPRPSVVVLSSSQLDRDRERLQHLPVSEFLIKPLTQEKVTAILARHFTLAQ